MANVDIETVVQDLNRRFAEPLPEFYNRRIIFWYDEDKEFEDKVDDVVLSNATLVKMTGTNNFAVKKLLCHDDKSGNYVVYSPISYAEPDDNWLIGMEQYSEEYRSDLNSIWMSEMGLPASAAIRKLIKEYRKFFNSKERSSPNSMNRSICFLKQSQLCWMISGVIIERMSDRPEGSPI